MESINRWVLSSLLCHRRIKGNIWYCSRNALHCTEEWKLDFQSPFLMLWKKIIYITKNCQGTTGPFLSAPAFPIQRSEEKLPTETGLRWPVSHQPGAWKGKKVLVPISNIHHSQQSWISSSWRNIGRNPVLIRLTSSPSPCPSHQHTLSQA